VSDYFARLAGRDHHAVPRVEPRLPASHEPWGARPSIGIFASSPMAPERHGGAGIGEWGPPLEPSDGAMTVAGLPDQTARDRVFAPGPSTGEGRRVRATPTLPAPGEQQSMNALEDGGSLDPPSAVAGPRPPIEETEIAETRTLTEPRTAPQIRRSKALGGSPSRSGNGANAPIPSSAKEAASKPSPFASAPRRGPLTPGKASPSPGPSDKEQVLLELASVPLAAPRTSTTSTQRSSKRPSLVPPSSGPLTVASSQMSHEDDGMDHPPETAVWTATGPPTADEAMSPGPLEDRSLARAMVEDWDPVMVGSVARSRTVASPAFEAVRGGRATRRDRESVMEGSEEPTVHVTIGRIEVRAVHPEPPEYGSPPAPAPAASPLSLDEYLERRKGK
jgi:hypothetical protein